MDRLYELSEGFRRSLKSHHEEEFENTTDGDMRKEIRDIQLLRDKTNNMMDMNRLRMFLDGMEELEKVLLQLKFPGTRGVMSMVWGSVKFLLRTTNTTERAFDGVLDVYGLLGAQLLALTQFKELFQKFPPAIECIVNIYDDIQRFHFTSYKLFSLTAKLWQRLQRSVWDDASGLFSRLSASLGSHAKLIKDHYSIQGELPSHNSSTEPSNSRDPDTLHAPFQQYSYGIKLAWKNFEIDEIARRRERKYEVTQWITSSRKMQRLQNEFREMAICPKSGRWVFRNYSDISEWMGEEDPPHSAIWLHANVGYDDSKTCYFYCQENDIEHRNHLDILKGILLQMVEAEDYIIPYCYQEKISSGGSILIDAKLAQKLIKTFIEFSVRHYIVIDGVDECHGAEIDQTTKFFKDLVSAYDTQIRLGHLRVLFIGRETSDTKKYVPGDDCISIALRSEDNHDDIRAFVQKKLPEFSKYLTLPCFIQDINYREHQRSEHAKFGWFSFQDYACAHWLHHTDTLIRECSEVFTSETFRNIAAEFAFALKHFVDTHRADLTTIKHVELVADHIEKFVDFELYEDLYFLWNHIYTHQRGDYATRNAVGIKRIENGLKDNRTQLEILFVNHQKIGDEDTIDDYYGSKPYKCNRTLCRFFHAGYNNARDRDNHGKRHERPFQCPVSCNAAPLGFVSYKDRERHVNIYHAELSEGPPIFETLSRRQVSGRFVCQICNKTFTRNINLKSHERSHFGDRPYSCTTCRKAFARINDCRRHEKIHAKRGY
ncbi:Uncharacterized protein LW93_12334 [Fusarium fujikuroi]|nr:Uncharacterized protein LW93_12334 [Fusarium fujikuroi]